MADRRARFALNILRLQNRLDGLLADHARMIHSTDPAAKLIGEALCKTFTQLDALGWQQREEDDAFRTLLNHLQF